MNLVSKILLGAVGVVAVVALTAQKKSSPLPSTGPIGPGPVGPGPAGTRSNPIPVDLLGALTLPLQLKLGQYYALRGSAQWGYIWSNLLQPIPQTSSDPFVNAPEVKVVLAQTAGQDSFRTSGANARGDIDFVIA